MGTLEKRIEAVEERMGLLESELPRLGQRVEELLTSSQQLSDQVAGLTRDLQWLLTHKLRPN